MSTRINAIYGQIGVAMIVSGLKIAHQAASAMNNSSEKAKVIKDLKQGHGLLSRAAATANSAVAFKTPILASAGGPKRDAQNA